MEEKNIQKILNYLEEHGRADLHVMSNLMDIPETEIANEIEDLKKNGVICGYTTIINWDKTSNEIVTALIEVKVSPQTGLGFDHIGNLIAKFPEVTNIYLMSGGYDFMVIIEGKSMKEVSRFVFDKLSTIESVSSTATHFILKKYKDHGTILENEDDENEKREAISF